MAEKLYLPKAMNWIKPMFGKNDEKKNCLPKKSNLIIMAWKTSDFLVLNEPWLTVLLTKVINIIDMKKKWPSTPRITNT